MTDHEKQVRVIVAASQPRTFNFELLNVMAVLQIAAMLWTGTHI